MREHGVIDTEPKRFFTEKKQITPTQLRIISDDLYQAELAPIRTNLRL